MFNPNMINPGYIVTKTDRDITISFRDVIYAQIVNPQYELFELIIQWLIMLSEPKALSLERAGNLIAYELLMRHNEGNGQVYYDDKGKTEVKFNQPLNKVSPKDRLEKLSNTFDEIEKIVNADYYQDSWGTLAIKIDSIKEIINKSKEE